MLSRVGCSALFGVFIFLILTGRVLPMSGRWPVAKNKMTIDLHNLPRLGVDTVTRIDVLAGEIIDAWRDPNTKRPPVLKVCMQTAGGDALACLLKSANLPVVALRVAETCNTRPDKTELHHRNSNIRESHDQRSPASSVDQAATGGSSSNRHLHTEETACSSGNTEYAPSCRPRHKIGSNTWLGDFLSDVREGPSVYDMSLMDLLNSLPNVIAHPRGQKEPEKQTECFPASDAAPCSTL
jgi:hypothetical protein